MGFKRRLTIFILIMFFLVVGIIYFSPPTGKNSLITVGVGDFDLDEDLISTLNISIFASERELELSKNIPVNLNFEGDIYQVELVKVLPERNRTGIFFSDFDLGFTFHMDQERKIDINSDGFYDISLKLEDVYEGKALFLVEGIKEEKSTTGDIGLILDRLRGDVQEKTIIQDYIIMAILVLVLLAVLIHLYLAYLVPYMKNKELMETDKPKDALKYLHKEIKKKKDPNEKKKIYSRIQHLYGYLSKKEKKKAESIMKEVENIKLNKWKNI